MVDSIDIVINAFFKDNGAFKEVKNQLTGLQRMANQVATQMKSFDTLMFSGNTLGRMEQANNYLEQFDATINKRGKIVNLFDKRTLADAQKISDITDNIGEGGFRNFNNMASEMSKVRKQTEFTTGQDLISPFVQQPEIVSGTDMMTGQVKQTTAEMDKLSSRITALQRQYQQLGRAGQQAMAQLQAGVKSAGNIQQLNTVLANSEQNLNDVRASAEGFRGTFSQEFLGILFFGMQMQQLFLNLARTTTQSFMKITEGSTSSGQAISALTANFELLKFSVGSAVSGVLESLLPIIVPLVTKISDWVQQNEQLAGRLIFVGIALGTLMFLVGTFVLGIEAVINAVWHLQAALGSAGALFGEGGFFASIGLTSAGAVVTAIAVVIAVIVVLVAAWKANFGGIKDFTTKTFGLLFDTIGTVMMDIFKIIGTIMEIIVAIFEGDWEKVGKLTLKLLLQLLSGIGKLLARLGMLVLNALSFIYNILVDALKSIIKLVITVSKQWNKLFLNMGKAMINFLAKPIDFILQKVQSFVNKITRALNAIPGVSAPRWLRNLDLPAASDISGFIDNLKAANDLAGDDLLSGVDEVADRIKTGFFGKEAGKNVDDFFEKAVGNVAMLTGITDVFDGSSSTSKDGGLDSALKQIQDTMAGVQTQSAAVEATSQSVEQQNVREADSWRMKNNELERYLSLIERLPGQSGTINEEGFSQTMPNFTTQNL